MERILGLLQKKKKKKKKTYFKGYSKLRLNIKIFYNLTYHVCLVTIQF